MKKIIIFLLSVLLMLGLAACNTGNNDRAVDGEAGGRVEIDTDTGSGTEAVTDTDSKDKKSDDDKTSAADDESETGKESGTGTETETGTGTETDSSTATEGDQKPVDDPDKEDPEKDEENPLFELDLNLETPTVTLPASVGENPFKGKTFTKGEEEVWIFSDQENTVKEEIHRTDREDSWKIYNYSYNAQKNVIYLALKTLSWGDSSYSSLAEYWEIMKEMMKENPDKPVSEDMIESALKSMARNFSTIEVYQYKISEGTIAFKYYYDPACPNYSGFYCSDETEEAGFRTLINFKRGEGLWLWPKGSTGNGDGYHCMFPEMKDGQLSGDIYYEDEMIGSIKATYTVSGEGTSDCTMTIKFSELPEIMTDFTTGKEYLLSINRW